MTTASNQLRAHTGIARLFTQPSLSLPDEELGKALKWRLAPLVRPS
jgi:hypothetical protein